MPTVILMRHGKSDWSEERDDLRRPLAPRGRRAAELMGRFLAQRGYVPDVAITSPAERAFQTVRVAMEAGGWSSPVREANGLYGGEPRDLIRELRREQASVQLVLAVGHEPAWSNSVAELTGGGMVSMPTAAAACVDLGDGRWDDVGPGTAVLLWLVTPRLVDNR